MVNGLAVKLTNHILLGQVKAFRSFMDDSRLSFDLEMWYGRWLFAKELLHIESKEIDPLHLGRCRLVSYYTFMRGHKYHV
jgi:hypothetical protein